MQLPDTQIMLKRATGALYGALIGDSLGGRYEFSNGKYDDELYNPVTITNNNGYYFNEYIPIKGGGFWNLVPGQITDDGELTLTLAHAIIVSGTIDQESIAENYRKWYISEPFDIGNTTKNSFSQINTIEMLKKSKQYDTIIFAQNNDHAKSNGMLMRISPIAIVIAGYIYKIIQENNRDINENDYLNIINFVAIDTMLTHYSEDAIYYVVTYVILIAYSIIYGNMLYGVNVIKKYQKKNKGDWYDIFSKGLDIESKLSHDPQHNMSDSRIALQLAIRKGKMISTIVSNQRCIDFSEAIISTIKLGGDTDTNACIVGALCGSIVGIDEIPENWTKIIRDHDVQQCNRYQYYKINKYSSQLETIANILFNTGILM